MDIAAVRQLLQNDTNNITKFGRTLGRELPKKRIKLLREFWVELGRIPEKSLNYYERGYRAALIDVARSYEAEFYYETNVKKQKEFVIKEEYKPILKALLAKSQTAQELAHSLEVDYARLNAKLKELRGLSLVDGFPGLFQRLTISGEKIAKTLD